MRKAGKKNNQFVNGILHPKERESLSDIFLTDIPLPSPVLWNFSVCCHLPSLACGRTNPVTFTVSDIPARDSCLLGCANITAGFIPPSHASCKRSGLENLAIEEFKWMPVTPKEQADRSI